MRFTSLLLLPTIVTIASASLGTNCTDWNTVYGKQWWATEAIDCRKTAPTNNTLIGSDGLGCGVNAGGESTIYAKLYYRNCKDFAQSPPLPCPVCNSTNVTTAPSISPSPSPKPGNLIDTIPVLPGTANETTGNSTTGSDDKNSSDSSDSTANGSSTGGDDNIQEVTPVGEASGAQGVTGSNSSGGSVCLHGSMRVRLDTGRTVRIDALKTGDTLVESNHVYMFSHKSREYAQFINITTASGRWIAITPGHLVHTPRGLRSAEELRLGDVLDGGHRIVGKKSFFDFGVYNPHTIRGDIVVNGLRASTYTSHIPSLAAHGALSFVRAIWYSFGVTTNVFHCGVPSLSYLSGSATCVSA